ncbi:unnamed protein product [Nesidiocoris tenuis]|uniref:Uncharacterized protein n=1 Tax=Nesidiocoris tenuis TaxID=355587 RepID=A0A6H5GRQ6_9HEMI|nr:unnamed protein product [Nesidiocoris tenuis]
MRLKSCMICFIGTVALTLVFLIFGDEQAGLQNFVSDTHRHIRDNFKIIKLATFCNSSRCIPIKFEPSLFPPHVANEEIHAFRPLIIQDAVRKCGSVLFMENDQRLTTGGINNLVNVASQRGILTWRAPVSVMAMTHPRMLRYLATTSEESLLFTPMVDSSRLIVYNTAAVSRNILLPWVKCTLKHDCIQPLGAQSVGCRFDKKPVYRYSGCHGHDTSALSVLLGFAFKFDTDSYSIQQEVTKVRGF